MKYWGLSKIQPNPRIDSVREGVKIIRENDIDYILAVGAGSVIDCSKAISAASYYDEDPWQLFVKKPEIEKAVPIGVVLTLAATGTEMNLNCALSNVEGDTQVDVAKKAIIKTREYFKSLECHFT